METIGDKIKRLRKVKGLSLRDLSKRLDISDTALSNIETGKTKSITIELGKSLCSVFDVPFNELFEIGFDSQEGNNSVALKNQLKELISQISDKDNLIQSLKNELTNVRSNLIRLTVEGRNNLQRMIDNIIADDNVNSISLEDHYKNVRGIIDGDFSYKMSSFNYYGVISNEDLGRYQLSGGKFPEKLYLDEIKDFIEMNKDKLKTSEDGI